MPYDLMQFVDEEIEEASGGGTFICQFELGVGWDVWGGGDRTEKYFKVTTPENKASQKELANALCEKLGPYASGAKRWPNFSTSVYLFADSVLNRPETPNWTHAGPGIWAHDVAVSTPAYKQVLAPTLLTVFGDPPQINWYSKYWGEVGFAPNPRNEKSGRDDKVPQILRIFESEEEARQAVVDGGGSVSQRLPDTPDNFDESTLGQWSVYASDVLLALESGEDGTYFLAPKYGFGPAELAGLKKYHEKNSIPF